jgi:hypothetical protein
MMNIRCTYTCYVENDMSPELDAKLCQKYPLLFRNRRGDPTETLMCFGFECHDGWYDLIDVLCGNIQSHINSVTDSRKWTLEHNRKIKEDPTYLGLNGQPYEPRTVPCPIEQVVVQQVKEKFGTLRFYYYGGDDRIQGMVSLAESMSGVICEECGNRGEIREGGWYRTLCDQHHVKRGLGAGDDFLP